MTMHNVAFYISGHGYGHSTRMSEILRALAAGLPELTVYIRTTAPPGLFQDLPRISLDYQQVEVDSGVVENDDTLGINQAATLARMESFLRGRDSLCLAETEFVQRKRISLLVADIPYLAGRIARSASVPCVGVGNFLWDWIYEPYVFGRAGAGDLLACIRADYTGISTLLRLPFSHAVNIFDEVIDVPLVARHSRRNHGQILSQLGLDSKDHRPRVLMGMRSPLFRETLYRAANTGRDYCFVGIEPLPPNLPENVQRASLGPNLSFPDLVSVCSVVVSKLGYGMVSEAIANGAAILYPPRSEFREDELLLAGVGRSFRAMAIPVDEFVAGNWADHLRRLMALPRPIETLRTDGASVCANIIAERLMR